MATYGQSGEDVVRQAARNRIQRSDNNVQRRGRAFGPEPGRSNNVFSGNRGNRIQSFVGTNQGSAYNKR